MKDKLAVITGADGGMGRVITTAIAKAGYQVIMACRNIESGNKVCEQIKIESSNKHIEVRAINLASLTSVHHFAETLLQEKRPISLLVNNAGVLTTDNRKTIDGLDTIVSVNYVSPYLLTRLLLPLMPEGTRIINTISCTYAIGKIPEYFFEKGTNRWFNRISVYSNTKLALLLFTQELAKRVKEKGILVNAADPGIVNTNIIIMHAWFDPLTNIFFRPFIRKPVKGAATTIHLALSEEANTQTGCCYASCKEKKLSKRFTQHPVQEKLWLDTELLLIQKGIHSIIAV